MLTENLPSLTRDIERLGRRAERLGTAPLVLRDTGRREGPHAFVVLEGEPPALLGWRDRTAVRGRPGDLRLLYCAIARFARSAPFTRREQRLISAAVPNPAVEMHG